MSIETLAHELIELRQTAQQLLDAGDIEPWLDAMPAEFRAAERLKAYLLQNPVVVTDDPARDREKPGATPTSASGDLRIV